MAETGGTSVPIETGSEPYRGGVPVKTNWPVKSGKEESGSKKAAEKRMAKARRNHGKTGGTKAPSFVPKAVAGGTYSPDNQKPS